MSIQSQTLWFHTVAALALANQGPISPRTPFLSFSLSLFLSLSTFSFSLALSFSLSFSLDEHNQRILHLIGDRIRDHQLPVIVSGDFNIPVGVLLESGSHVLRPKIEVPTLVTKNGASFQRFCAGVESSAVEVQGYIC